MKGIENVFTHHGISVDAWVNLDSNCEIKTEVFGELLQIEFGSRAGSLGLVVTEDVMDRLAVVFAETKARLGGQRDVAVAPPGS